MALARGTQIRPTTFELPILQLPFEQIMGNMVTAQQSYDEYEKLAALMPNTLSRDKEYAERYKNYVSAVAKDITDSFMSGSTEQALRKLETGKRALSEEWTPGGIAYGLQNRYESYQKGLEELKKAHEKDPTAMNKEFGQHMFDAGIQDFGYDPVSRTGKTIGAPNIYNYTDIKSKLLEIAKAMDVDMTEQDILKGRWILRMKDAGIPEDRIQAAYEGVMNSPEVLQQKQVEFWNKTRGYTDEERKALGIKNIDDTINQIKAQREKFNKLSLEEKQRQLKGFGLYKGDVNSKDGPLTKDAIEKYNEYLDKQVSDYEKYKQDPDSYLMKEVVDKPYNQLFGALFGEEHSRQLRVNPYELAKFNHSLRMKLQDRQFDFERKLREVESKTGLLTPSTAMDIGKEIGEYTKDTKEAYTKSQKNFSRTYGSPEMKKALGTTGNYEKDYKKLDKMLKAYYSPDGNIKTLEQYAQSMGVSPDEAQNSYMALRENASDIARSLESAAELKMANDKVTNWESAIYEKLATNKVNEIYSKYKNKGETKEEFTKALTEASNMSVAEMKQSGKHSRFLKIPSATASKTDRPAENIASNLVKELRKETQAKVDAGDTFTGMATWAMSGTSKEFGAGKISNEVKEAIKGNFAGLADLNTNNSDKFTNYADAKRRSIDLNDIDPDSVTIRTVGSARNKYYRIEGKDANGNRIAIHSKIPESHMPLVKEELTNEFASAVNKGNLQAAKQWALQLENDDSSNIIGLGMQGFNSEKINNELLVYGKDERFSFNRPHQTVANYNTSGGNTFEIIKFQDKSGNEKFALVFRGSDGKGRLMGKPTFDANGQINAKGDHQSLSDLYYDNADDVRESAVLFKQSEEVPIEETIKDIPKVFNPLNLGDKRILSIDNELKFNFSELYDEF